MIISQNNWNKIKSKFKNYKIEKNYKIIAYDPYTNLNLVGFLAIISKILAEKGISINALSAYNRDYFLIKKQKSRAALNELNKYLNNYKIQK